MAISCLMLFMEAMEKMERFKSFHTLAREVEGRKLKFPLEVRVSHLTYKVPVPVDVDKIRTVYNMSPVYFARKFFQRIWRGEKKEQAAQKVILDDISLMFKPGRMYLVLGPPGAGKTSLLKAISNRLDKKKGYEISGDIVYNGRELKVSRLVSN